MKVLLSQFSRQQQPEFLLDSAGPFPQKRGGNIKGNNVQSHMAIHWFNILKKSFYTIIFHLPDLTASTSACTRATFMYTKVTKMHINFICALAANVVKVFYCRV